MTPDFDDFYTPGQQSMQERFGTARLANSALQAIVYDEIDDKYVPFIESRDFFFLATVDSEGRPTVSYKGGPPGVCHVVDKKTLIFPAYDGNGMFKSMGNAADTGKVGLLFIDFETPFRVRVQGEASLHFDHSEMDRYPGTKMIVEVAVESSFANCARYIHKHTRVSASPYVPDEKGNQPHPSWKRIDIVQEVISEEDRKRTADAGGTITEDEYLEKVMSGTS